MSARGRLWLIASMIFNIFLIGAIVGGIYGWRHGYGVGPRQGWRMEAANALSPSQARAFRAAMRDEVRGARPLIATARAARGDAMRLFMQPQFDAAGVSAELRQARDADVALRTRLENRVVLFAATLPPSERVALAQALRRGPLRQPVPK